MKNGEVKLLTQNTFRESGSDTGCIIDIINMEKKKSRFYFIFNLGLDDTITKKNENSGLDFRC
jgi:hypothetical protein